MASRGVNKVILVGNLGQDPEIRYMPNGGAVANITLATSESWRDKATGEQKEKTEWHRVVLFGKLAEVAGEYLKKGSQVYIEGKLNTRKWTDQAGVDPLDVANYCAFMHFHGWPTALKGDQVPVGFTSESALDDVADGDTAMFGPDRAVGRIPLFTAPQKPVVLPQAHKVRDGVTLTGDERIVMIPCNNGNWLSKFDVEHAIKMAGGIVKDGE